MTAENRILHEKQSLASLLNWQTIYDKIQFTTSASLQ